MDSEIAKLGKGVGNYAAGGDNPLRRLSGVVEFPMLPRARVGGVYDRMVEKWIGHETPPEGSWTVTTHPQLQCG
jgi:hypothetical protein